MLGKALKESLRLLLDILQDKMHKTEVLYQLDFNRDNLHKILMQLQLDITLVKVLKDIMP
ncbi:MAG: hypothetical protein EBS59_06470 [Verrucomicrobia bacterium]|nr:hypothetical protein [Verrucomicrobiota bacterium]